MISDLKQRQYALDIAQSFIVQAPAGSGKTELLTQRYLKLLSVCQQPENIIATTFTNKAADELLLRILSALESSQYSAPSEPHKQITYALAQQVMKRSNEQDWQLLQNPKRLKITTIDGLSSLIVNRYPSAAQPVPKRIMAQQWERDKAYQYATEQTLLMIDDAQHGKAITDLLLYLDNHVDRFLRLTTKMLQKRDQWLGRLYHEGTLDANALQKTAKSIIEAHLRCLKKFIINRLDDEFFRILQGNTKTEYAQITQLPETTVEALPLWKSLADLLLQGGATKKNAWRTRVDKRNGFDPKAKQKKQDFVDFLFALQSDDALRNLLFELFSLPDVDFSPVQGEVLRNMAQVLKLCVAQLNVYFEQQQVQDFIQVALDANQALDTEAEVNDIALCLDYQLQHLLVDEFQDTSITQFNTIEKLMSHWQMGDGKTVFLVGDPMQSIYRFRESQVGLFLQAKTSGIANIKPTALLLSTNFRSSKSIVENNNALFQKLFPSYSDIYQGAIAYEPSQAASTKVNNQATVFYPFADGQAQLEAEKVLDIIQQSQSSNPDAEIAILVRNRSHLSHIVPLLRAHHIAFQALKTTPLQNHLLVRDLLSLTKALLHLGDKLAWLSLLRSPWCGLKLDDLLILSSRDDEIIYQQLVDEAVLAELSEDGQNRARHLHDCMQDSIEHQGRFSFSERLMYSIKQLGVNETLGELEQSIKNQFLQIINNCEQQQALNIESINSQLAELYAPSETANVKIMTIHESKGLEFDVVILPGLGKTTRADDAPIIQLKTFANESLLLAPIKSASQTNESDTYRYLKFIDAQQNHFETMRLLYVAMTRAKSQLHLLGAVNRSKKAASRSLLTLLMPFYQQHFEQLPSMDKLFAEAKPTPPLLQRLKTLQAPHSKPSGEGEAVVYQRSIELAFKSVLGTLVHEYLEQGLFSPSDDNLNTRLIEIGTPPSALVHWREFVLKLLSNTQQDAQFEWLFKDRTSTLVEAEFVGSNGRSIIIDRLFIDNDILWIIDFKTAELADYESLDDFIIKQQAQHSKQLALYKTVLTNIYDNKIRCALYFPAIPILINVR